MAKESNKAVLYVLRDLVFGYGACADHSKFDGDLHDLAQLVCVSEMKRTKETIDAIEAFLKEQKPDETTVEFLAWLKDRIT
jgi:hypothetical protein